MTDRLPCRACGHLILPTTAARNDGLCMPCKGGYRQNIEDGKRFHTERRRYLTSPQALYWSALVNRVYDGRERFAGLSPAERSYYAVSVLSGEVHNGGFDQYFGNSSGDQYQAARAGLRELEAEDALALLERAAALLFGDGRCQSPRPNASCACRPGPMNPTATAKRPWMRWTRASTPWPTRWANACWPMPATMHCLPWTSPMKPELDALEAWLGQPLPAAFVAALEQHGGRLVEPDLLLYAADELLERNRAFETSLLPRLPGHRRRQRRPRRGDGPGRPLAGAVPGRPWRDDPGLLRTPGTQPGGLAGSRALPARMTEKRP